MYQKKLYKMDFCAASDDCGFGAVCVSLPLKHLLQLYQQKSDYAELEVCRF